MPRISVEWRARDVRATYTFFVDELRRFRLGGNRFYGSASLDDMVRVGEVFLESVDLPGFELILRAAPSLPTPGEDNALILETSDVASVFERLRSRELGSGARLISDRLLDTPHGEAFWVADPSGHRIHVHPMWRPRSKK